MHCIEKAVEKKLAQKDYLPRVKKVRFSKNDIFIEEIEKKIRENNLLLKKIEYLIQKYK